VKSSKLLNSCNKFLLRQLFFLNNQLHLDGLFNKYVPNASGCEVSKMALEVHALEVERVHNDTTSITFAGAYERPGRGAVGPKVGFNKDHRGRIASRLSLGSTSPTGMCPCPAL
jgi:hypothetical protein